MKNLNVETVRFSSPGTCGELVQGFLDDREPFHITLPVKQYADIELSACLTDKLEIHNLPSDKLKVRRALELALEAFGLSGATIEIEDFKSLPYSKGMASSTADILCSVCALAQSLGFQVNPDLLAKIATNIESSDGIMYPGICAVNHKTGRCIESFEWFPDFSVMMLIPKQVVPTESVDFKGKEKCCSEFENLLKNLRRASIEEDEAAFANAATFSAELNQQYLRNELFELYGARFKEFGALGVCVAHTGSVIGFLYSNSESQRMFDASEALKDQLKPQVDIICTSVEGERQWV